MHTPEGLEVTVDNLPGAVVGAQDIWTGPTNYAMRNNICAPGGVKVRYTPDVGPRVPLSEARDRFERDYILQTLNAQGGNMSRTAEVLGVERSNLYKKLRAFGVTPRGQ